jgi:alpha-1,2-glucosyltransferase
VLPRNAIFGALTGFYGCDAASLRAVNALALTALVILAMLCRREIEARLHEVHSRSRVTKVSQYAAHTALNVALFPTLFFFGGLYYTDVLSTVAVLAASLHSLRRLHRDTNPVWSDALSVLLGVVTLFMRQTNVFWVVVFLGGIEAVHAVKTIRPRRVDKPMTSDAIEHAKFVLWRYSVGDVHDPPLSQGAGPEGLLPCPIPVMPGASFADALRIDMLYVAVSLCVAATCNLPRVLRQVWPHITVLVAFAGFVVWNGGVVLGRFTFPQVSPVDVADLSVQATNPTTLRQSTSLRCSTYGPSFPSFRCRYLFPMHCPLSTPFSGWRGLC